MGWLLHPVVQCAAAHVKPILNSAFLAMETGVIDGIVIFPALVKAFKLYEVADFGVSTSFGCVSEGLFVNKKFWKKLPNDLSFLSEYRLSWT
ncbi:hypothetical protein [Desulfocicer niacini]